MEETQGHLDALAHALTFAEGDEVNVAAPRYTGPGVLKKGRDESIIVWYDHVGVGLNVLLPNGNVWTYPALTVTKRPAA